MKFLSVLVLSVVMGGSSQPEGHPAFEVQCGPVTIIAAPATGALMLEQARELAMCLNGHNAPCTINTIRLARKAK